MKELKNLLEKTQIDNILSQTEIEKIRKAINTINNYYEKGGKVDTYERSLRGIKIKNIKEALDCLLAVIIREPITISLKDLTRKIVKFALDWNKKFSRDSEIERLCLTIKRFLECHFSIIEAIQIIKKLLKRINKIQKFSPPVFKLSQNYLKSLEQKPIKRSKNEMKNKDEKNVE